MVTIMDLIHQAEEQSATAAAQEQEEKQHQRESCKTKTLDMIRKYLPDLEKYLKDNGLHPPPATNNQGPSVVYMIGYVMYPGLNAFAVIGQYDIESDFAQVYLSTRSDLRKLGDFAFIEDKQAVSAFLLRRKQEFEEKAKKETAEVIGELKNKLNPTRFDKVHTIEEARKAYKQLVGLGYKDAGTTLAIWMKDYVAKRRKAIREDQREAERARRKEEAAIAFEAAYAEWFVPRAKISLANQAAFAKLQKELDQPYWLARCHYGIVARDDSDAYVNTDCATVLADENGAIIDDGYLTVVMSNGKLIARKILTIFAWDVPFQVYPTERKHAQWMTPHYSTYWVSDNLYFPPIYARDSVRIQVENALTKIPPDDEPYPKGLTEHETSKIKKRVKNNFAGGEYDDITNRPTPTSQ